MKTEFRRVLRNVCHGAAHVKAVIDHIVDTAMRFPPPAELASTAQDVPYEAAGSAPRGCDECQRTGYRQIERKAMQSSIKAEGTGITYPSALRWKVTGKG